MQTYTIGQNTYTVLFPDLIRPLTPVEREELKESIRQRGRVMVAVVVDEDYGIIDGINRIAVASELGIDRVPFEIRTGLTWEEKRALALELNDVRRQQTRREIILNRRKRIKRVTEKRLAGESEYKIAQDEGVSRTMIQKILAEAREDGIEIPTPDRVKAKDGKERVNPNKGRAYPTPKEKVEKEKPKKIGGARRLDGKPNMPSILNDQLGRRVPNNLRDVFGTTYLPDQIGQLRQLVGQLILISQQWARYVRASDAVPALQQVIQCLQDGVPYAVHPLCNGQGCDRCKQVGYVPRWRYDEMVRNGEWE